MSGGVVTAQDGRAAQAGARVLAAGGNAVDAAVAAALAIGVVEPCMSGLGGCAWIVVQPPGEPCSVVDGSGLAPAAARADMFELDDAGGSAGFYGWPQVRGDANIRGGRSACVPGAVAALCLAHEAFGRLERERVFAPAIELAAEGIEVNGFLSALITQDAYNLREDPGCAALFLPNGLPLRPAGLGEADVLRQPALAATLQRIAEEGPRGFYEGPVAEAIAAALAARAGADGDDRPDPRRSGGLDAGDIADDRWDSRRSDVLTTEDLAGYRAALVAPAEARFGDADVRVAPATGGPSVIQALHLFEAATRRRPADPPEVRWALALRLAFADRFEHMSADPRAGTPWEELLSPARAEAAVAAAPSHAPLETPAKSGCTSHLNVVDGDGMTVALTSTLLDVFGARVLDPESGVLLNDGMMWFDPRPGRVNSILPGAPGMTAAAPALLVRDGRALAAAGASGGRPIISAIAQILEGLLAGLDPQTAIDRPRLHCEGELVRLHERAGEAAVEALRAAGETIELVEETSLTWGFARPNAIAVDPGGARSAGIDRLRPAAAIAA